MIGQKKKGITSIIIYIVIDVLAYVISTLLCVIGIGLLFYCFAYCFGFIFSIFTAIDGHKVATKLAAGESLMYVIVNYIPCKITSFHE
eukprot:EC820409.1.p1 GENE.EC820409.1~~EC820409.1.p1  ORF type:complete len:88 (+),score=13.18 EC820409.1:33-296(+)